MASVTATPPDTAVQAKAPGDVEREPLKMTYDEYVAWSKSAEGNHGEWVDGEVIIFVTTSDRHQRITTFLILLIGNYLALRRAGRLFSQTFELRSREGAACEPDIVVLLNEHLDRLEDVRVAGAADLVVEVVSPDSVTRDRRDKLAEYAAAGIPEYWVVDPREGHETVELFKLDSEGYYVGVAPEPDGRLRSLVLPGVWIETSWVAYEEELPNVVQLGMEMAEAAQAPAATEASSTLGDARTA